MVQVSPDWALNTEREEREGGEKEKEREIRVCWKEREIQGNEKFELGQMYSLRP